MLQYKRPGQFKTDLIYEDPSKIGLIIKKKNLLYNKDLE